MAAANTVVLITGANRGIGFALLQLYLAQPNHTVIAGIRNINTTIQAKAGPGSKLIPVKIDSTIQTDASEAVNNLETEHGITHIDLVIANAGISQIFPQVRDLDTQDLQRHIICNVYGVVWLYQATRCLLEKSEHGKFVTMGSGAGHLENQPPIPNAAYGPSKTAVHWITKRIDVEEEKIAAFIVDPGFVTTDMGTDGAKALGVPLEMLISVEESTVGVKAVVDAATKEGAGGRLWSYKGEREAW